MRPPVVEQYDPSTFRKWHDGPVVILSTLSKPPDCGHATYVLFRYIKEVDDFLNEKITRPFVGTIFLMVPDKYYQRLNEKYKELDIRLLKG